MKTDDKSGKEITKALKTIVKDVKSDPEQRQGLRDFASWWMSQNATAKGGGEIVVNGRHLSNANVAFVKLANSNNPNAVTAALTISGQLDPKEIDEAEKKRRKESQRKHRNTIARYKRNIIANLKKSDLYDPALLSQIDSIAHLATSIQEIEDYLAADNAPEVETVSREGARRSYPRSIISRHADLLCRKARADKDLILTALQLKKSNDLAKEVQLSELDKIQQTVAASLMNFTNKIRK